MIEIFSREVRHRNICRINGGLSVLQPHRAGGAVGRGVLSLMAVPV
jgi:hypothetical protein